MSVLVEASLAPEPFDASAMLAAFAARMDGIGALASFTGIARPSAIGGGEVAALVLDHHPRLTLASLEAIGAAVAARFDLAGLRIVHRCGRVAPGDDIVFVAAAAVHRRAALEAVDYAMDRLKTEAVFWKREDYREGGTQWIEPTGGDHADRARWGIDDELF